MNLGFRWGQRPGALRRPCCCLEALNEAEPDGATLTTIISLDGSTRKTRMLTTESAGLDAAGPGERGS